MRYIFLGSPAPTNLILMPNLPHTLGELKRSRWAEPPLRGRSVRDEIRANVLRMLQSGEDLFPGIVGYEDTI
jgi:magnesium chelatase subunit I